MGEEEGGGKMREVDMEGGGIMGEGGRRDGGGR